MYIIYAQGKQLTEFNPLTKSKHLETK